MSVDLNGAIEDAKHALARNHIIADERYLIDSHTYANMVDDLNDALRELIAHAEAN